VEEKKQQATNHDALPKETKTLTLWRQHLLDCIIKLKVQSWRELLRRSACLWIAIDQSTNKLTKDSFSWKLEREVPSQVSGNIVDLIALSNFAAIMSSLPVQQLLFLLDLTIQSSYWWTIWCLSVDWMSNSPL
jgi:hypothetical protein